MEELTNWLNTNKIQYKIVEDDLIEIPGFGLAFFQDMENVNSIFRYDNNAELIFNCMEDPEVLLNDNICYVVFKFGDCWYYTDIREPFKMHILKYIGERVPAERHIPFVNLGVHTPYELLNGSFMPSAWVKKAKHLGQTAIGVCDRNTMASLFSLQKECKAAEMKFVFGYSLTFVDGGDKVDAKVYVQTQKGLQNLLRIQKTIMVDSEDQTIDINDLVKYGEGNVLVFGKLSAEYILSISGSSESSAPELKSELIHSFDDIFFQVDLSEYKAERIDVKVLNSQKLYFDKLYKKDLKPVLICDNYYLDKDDARNKIILNKVATGAAHEQSEDQYFKDLDEHFQMFQQTFGPDWDIEAIFSECCANTVEIAKNAEAFFETDRNFMPKYDMTPEEAERYGTSHNMFTQLLEDGLQRLVPAEKREQYRKQMEYEKYIIESTNNVDYLLVQYDTVNWCRRNGIQVGCGRGSAAGCLLLYLLGITLIDPIKYNLIFERFLLPERAGLYQSDTTIIGEDVEANCYTEIRLANGQTLKLYNDAELYVIRPGKDRPIRIYADELQEGDDILFDNKDELFTLNELDI